MNIIKFRKVYFTISGILVVASLLGLIFWGLPFGIDFTGGSLMELEYTIKRPPIQNIQGKIADFNLGDVFIQPIGEKGVILRFKSVDEPIHQKILNKIRTKKLDMLAPTGEKDQYIGNPENNPKNQVLEKRFNSIGPVIGRELKQKTIYAIFIALIVIVAFIAWAFRKVSQPISSWKYGIIAVVALFHDILIVLGAFVFLGRFMNFEVNAPFVAALLTILGYSVNDTIVIFDRIRENLKHYTPDFAEIVNNSVNQTLLRSTYTSLTTIFVLLALFFFGGETINGFVLALIIGIVSGTYSSIFLASPMLVTLEQFKKN